MLATLRGVRGARISPQLRRARVLIQAKTAVGVFSYLPDFALD
jgi:hypothetical protein